MPPPKVDIEYHEAPDFYGFGSTHLLIASHRIVDQVPTADVCRVTYDAGDDLAPQFACDMVRIYYMAPDDFLGEIEADPDPVKFVAAEALSLANRSLLSRIVKRCREARIPPPSGVEFKRGDWKKSFRLMRMHGLPNAMIEDIQKLCPAMEWQDFFRGLRNTVKPLLFERPQLKASVP